MNIKEKFMNLNEKKRETITIASIGSALLVITGIIANLSEIDRNRKEKETPPTEPTIIAEETIPETETSTQLPTTESTTELSTTEPPTELSTEPPTEPVETEIMLYELTPFNSGYTNGSLFTEDRFFIATKNLKDNVGNTYDSAMVQCDQYEPGGYSQYYVNGKYTNFSGTAFLPEENKNWNYDINFSISGDDVLLYSTTLVAGVLPQNFSLDISGVTILEIKTEVGYYSSEIKYLYGIGNPVLTVAQTE